MDNKPAEWVTVAQAAEITDRPSNSISNWYLYDKTVRHMRVSARRVLVHLGDCIEQDKIRSRRRRKPAPGSSLRLLSLSRWCRSRWLVSSAKDGASTARSCLMLACSVGCWTTPTAD